MLMAFRDIVYAFTVRWLWIGVVFIVYVYGLVEMVAISTVYLVALMPSLSPCVTPLLCSLFPP